MLRVAIATMGVLVREEQALPGAAEFSQRLIETDFLVLMNDSMFTPRDLAARLARSGLHAPEASIWTSGGGHGVRSWTTSCRAGRRKWSARRV